MATAKTKVQSLSTKFNVDLRKAMRARLVEREDAIGVFILALVAGTHAFWQGPPGIAKSHLVEVGIGFIDDLTPDEYFHMLMMKSTTREDVFGPLRLSLLKEDRYAYKSEGFLPVAKIAFIDEMWKGNSAILNALLWATNERLYRNDGKVERIPLHSMFIASNEFPESDELLAIYDRFPLRQVLEDIHENGNFVGMLSLSDAPQDKIVSWSEVEQAKKEVDAVTIPGDVLEALADVRDKLKAMSIFPSSRRFMISRSIVKARAWLDGETEADIEHLRPLKHVLWVEPDQFKKVDELVTGLSNPIDLEVMEIQAGLSGLSSELDKVIADPGDAVQARRKCTEIFDKIEITMEEMRGINKRLKGSKRRSDKMSVAKEQMVGLMDRLLVKGLKMSPEQIAETRLTAFGDLDEDDE